MIRRPFPAALAALAATLVLAAPRAFPQAAAAPMAAAAASQSLPVTRVALFSSGVGYFEHRGTVKGDATVSLPFRTAEVNDALKSLVIWNLSGAAGEGSPSVSYPSLEGTEEALRGLRIDLSGNPKMADILLRQRGAELQVETPESLSGRIVTVESRGTGENGAPRPTLVLLTAKGIRALALDDIISFRFTDPAVAADFDRALALILGSRDADRRVLDLRLPGTGSREAALGYIVAAPVWKASYRLDISGEKPWFQGWAIVDNPSEQDWKEVTLSLVSGRPVSFIQNLYAPLRLERPVLPLSIAGTAEAVTYDSGFGALADSLGADRFEAESRSAAGLAAPSSAPMMRKSAEAPAEAARGPSLASSVVETTSARAAGDQFEFTVRRPVSLERRRSAMLPLVAGAIVAEKFSVWSADAGATHPMLGVRLSNSLGVKLPAGPITVFDGGTYAGDALIEFFPEKERRIIAYGEDLSVTGADTRASSQETVGVTISKGVMLFSRRVTRTRSYSFHNGAATARKLLVEHPATPGAELTAPAAYDEKTPELYRFVVSLPAGGDAKLDVRERSPAQERVVLSSLGLDSFLAYASSSEIPAPVKEALRKAIDLRRKADDAKKVLADLGARKTEIGNDQGRIRQNLDAVGRDSSQGQQYLRRLMESEAELDSLASKIADARKASLDAQAAYDTYLANLSLN